MTTRTKVEPTTRHYLQAAYKLLSGFVLVLVGAALLALAVLVAVCAVGSAINNVPGWVMRLAVMAAYAIGVLALLTAILRDIARECAKKEADPGKGR